jgi:catechol 2,3-dioxygenase-like lactoylglutathione lyase family enzyme
MPELEPVVKFHLSLNVTNLARSVEFYRTFFDLAPAKFHDDYAKFELEEPPVIFSLTPHPPGPGGSLSHIGLRVPDKGEVVRYRDRLEAAGICTQAQLGTVCGYAKQDKCWIKDPDGNFWEIYHIEEDVDPVSVRQSVEGKAARIDLAPAQNGPVAWEHYVTNPFPECIPHEDAAVDEVRLTGTFNASLPPQKLRQLMAETVRVLKPGGKAVVHGLMADRPFPGAAPQLPGLAAMVARVPLQSEPIDYFRDGGLVGMQIVKFTENPWFVHDGVEMREVKIIAWKPATPAEDETRQVLYKGPFAQAIADSGEVFPRGQRVSVPLAVCNQLRLGPTAEAFLFLEPGAGASCSL